MVDPAASIEVGFYDTPGYAQGVAVVGSYVYVVDKVGRRRRVTFTEVKQ